MNIEDMKRVVNYMLDNNEKLVEEGKSKVTVEIVGEAGIGKTELLEQIAKERGMKFVKINLAQLEEVGDLVGIPVKEYKMISPNQEEKWVTEKVVPQFASLGYTICPTCEPRMSYAVPSWVPTDPEESCLLCLDDYTRGNQLFMQATMELVSRGEYVSWKLPKHTHIVLSSNPDDGEYSVSSMDAAQKTRYTSFTMEFDVKAWAKWAEQAQIRGEMINFALMMPEIFEKGRNVNARSYTIFANSVQNLNFDKVENLELASLIAKGCFDDKDNYVGNMFVTFVHNKLDKLITPDKMINGTWDNVLRDLKANIYPDGSKYRADIAATLTLRLVNYIDSFAFAKGAPKDMSDKVCNRILDIVQYKEKKLLTEDLIYNLIKKLNANHGTRVQKLILNPIIRQKILC